MEQNWLFIIIAAVFLLAGLALAFWRLAYPSRWHMNMLRYGRGNSQYRALRYFTKHFDLNIIPYAFAVLESDTNHHPTRALAATMLTKALDGERAKRILAKHLEHSDIQVRKNTMVSLITLDPWTPLPPLFKSLSGIAMNSDFQESDANEFLDIIKRRLAASPPSEEETMQCTVPVFNILPKLKNAYIQGPVSHRFLFFLELLRLLDQGPEQLVNAYADYMHAFPMESVIGHFLDQGYNREILFKNIEAALATEDMPKHRLKGLLMFLEQGARLGSWALNDSEAFNILSSVLQSKVWRHRAAVIKCLLLADSDYSFDKLLALSGQDEHEKVRTAARQALNELGFDDLLTCSGIIRSAQAARVIIDSWINRKLQDFGEKIFPKSSELNKLAAALTVKPLTALQFSNVLEKVITIKEISRESGYVIPTVESLIGLENKPSRKSKQKARSGDNSSNESSKRGRRAEIDKVALLDYTTHLT